MGVRMAAGQSPPERTKRRSRWSWPLLAPLAFLLIGLGYTAQALGLPLQTALGPGAGFVPILIGVLIIGSAAWALVSRAAGVPPGTRFELGEEAWRVVVLLALLFGYVVLLVPVGHLIAATFLGGGSLWILGRRPWWTAAGLGIGLSIGSWVLFDLVLGLPLPAGPGW